MAFEMTRVVEERALVVRDHADDRGGTRAAGGEGELRDGVLEGAGAQVVVGRTHLVVVADVMQLRGADALDDDVAADDVGAAAAVAAEAQVEVAEDVVHARDANGVGHRLHQAHVARLRGQREPRQRGGDERGRSGDTGGERLE